MRTKGILPAIHETHEETAISFKKEKSGHYRKIISKSIRDIRTCKIEKTSVEESEELYQLTDSDVFDHELFYDDIDGSKKSMRFKIVDQ